MQGARKQAVAVSVEEMDGGCNEGRWKKDVVLRKHWLKNGMGKIDKRKGTDLKNREILAASEQESAVDGVGYPKPALLGAGLAAGHVRKGDAEGGGGRRDLVPAPRSKLVDAWVSVAG
jgi:hypothetical protein